MKKIFAMLLAFLLLCWASALALMSSTYPAWDGQSVPSNALSGVIDGQAITLAFDTDPEFTTVADGMIEACFYAYDSENTNVIELFLMLPQKLQPGDVQLELCSVSILEGNPSDERAYFAGSLAGQLWPANCSIQLQLEQVQSDAQQLHISGNLSAKLCRLVNEMPTNEYIEISGARFDFTLPISSAAAPAAPIVPQFTLPPVYRVL